MRDMASSICAAGIVIALAAFAVVAVASDRLIYRPLAEALNRQVVVTVSPTVWSLDVRCPSCGHTWLIKGGTQ